MNWYSGAFLLPFCWPRIDRLMCISTPLFLENLCSSAYKMQRVNTRMTNRVSKAASQTIISIRSIFQPHSFTYLAFLSVYRVIFTHSQTKQLETYINTHRFCFCFCFCLQTHANRYFLFLTRWWWLSLFFSHFARFSLARYLTHMCNQMRLKMSCYVHRVKKTVNSLYALLDDDSTQKKNINNNNFHDIYNLKCLRLVIRRVDFSIHIRNSFQGHNVPTNRTHSIRMRVNFSLLNFSTRIHFFAKL